MSRRLSPCSGATARLHAGGGRDAAHRHASGRAASSPGTAGAIRHGRFCIKPRRWGARHGRRHPQPDMTPITEISHRSLPSLNAAWTCLLWVVCCRRAMLLQCAKTTRPRRPRASRPSRRHREGGAPQIRRETTGRTGLPPMKRRLIDASRESTWIARTEESPMHDRIARSPMHDAHDSAR